MPLFLMAVGYLAVFSAASCSASEAPTTPTPKASIVYVAADGSGDFNCNGKDDQVEINQALKYVAEHKKFTTVHLKGPNTYWISDTVYIGSDTILEAHKKAVIKLVNHANWPKRKPLVTMTKKGDHDITIRGFEIDGNDRNNCDYDSKSGYLRSRGGHWYNIIAFRGVTNIRVHDMYLHHNLNDALYISGCKNVYYHDNVILHGHDGLQAWWCSNVHVYNNRITNRTNCGIRISMTSNVKVYGNTITSYKGYGGAGIQIQKNAAKPMENVEVYDNVIYKTALSGILFVGRAKDPGRGVHIHHNVIYNAGTGYLGGGIAVTGFSDTLIEHNVIDGCYGSGISTSYVHSAIPPGSGYKTIVRNNIITNTRPHRLPERSGKGYGIWNKLSDTHSIVSENNCVYGNAGGNLKGSGITSKGDIHVAPLYADRAAHDYHLKSAYGRWDGKEEKWVKDKATSPCIDAGDPKSKWKNEPAPNGERINMGAYGNTAKASKSGGRP
ncbi:MAG: right-handed parallel beta-helix repeat-containing protein [Phycisphaerae bacterium]|nr:right-handed parallel beta-helix repeat-containing protein [Phycisphaerae bacterium]